MKKAISILLCTIFLTMLLTACGAGYNSPDAMWAGGNSSAPQAMPAPAPEMPEAEYYMDDMGDWDAPSEAQSESGILPVSAPVTEGMSEKIIYSVYANIETMSFEETVENVHTLMARYSAFIENSSVSGVNYESRYRGWNEYRRAYYSLRVPKDRLNAITADLDILGNVTNLTSNAENITSQFFDTQSRLNTLTIQEERLLTMLSKAEDIPDLIAIEERLGEVRYQIEALTTTLNNWQNQVDYSYLTLEIWEVEQFTEITEIHRTYWQQIGDGFMSTVRGVGSFFKDLFRWLIVSAPVLVILAVIAFVIFIIVRRSIRASNKKRANAIKSKPESANIAGYAPPAYAPPVYTPPENAPQAYTPPESTPPEDHE